MPFLNLLLWAKTTSASKMSSDTAGECTFKPFKDWKMPLQSGDSIITLPTFGYFQFSSNYSHNFLPSFVSNFRPELVYTYLLGMPNPSPFSPTTQWEKKVSITVYGFIFGGVAATVRPENQSVMSCPPRCQWFLPALHHWSGQPLCQCLSDVYTTYIIW